MAQHRAKLVCLCLRKPRHADLWLARHTTNVHLALRVTAVTSWSKTIRELGVRSMLVGSGWQVPRPKSSVGCGRVQSRQLGSRSGGGRSSESPWLQQSQPGCTAVLATPGASVSMVHTAMILGCDGRMASVGSRGAHAPFSPPPSLLKMEIMHVSCELA